MIRKIPRMSVHPPLLRYLTKKKNTQWSDRKKGFQLFIIVLAAIVPDFNSGIGLKSLQYACVIEISCIFCRNRSCFRFGRAVPNFVGRNYQYVHKVRKKYLQLSSILKVIYSYSWTIFLLGKILMLFVPLLLSSTLFFIGWGGVFFVMVMRRYGRLGTLFWTQVKLPSQHVFIYLFMCSLVFGIIIHGRRYVCTYTENICWYVYYLSVGESDLIFGCQQCDVSLLSSGVCLILTIAD